MFIGIALMLESEGMRAKACFCGQALKTASCTASLAGSFPLNCTGGPQGSVLATFLFLEFWFMLCMMVMYGKQASTVLTLLQDAEIQVKELIQHL